MEGPPPQLGDLRQVTTLLGRGFSLPPGVSQGHRARLRGWGISMRMSC